MCQICEYYEQETQRSAKQGAQRIEEIKKYLKENNLTLDEITLICNKDYKWNQRKNRTPKEQQAKIIGQTNDTQNGYPQEIWWIHPK